MKIIGADERLNEPRGVKVLLIGPTVFGWTTGTTELAEDDIADWLLAIIDPLGGDVVQWAYAERWND